MNKHIGKGWQYRVYDIGNGRVRKIKRKPVDSFGRIFFMPKPAPEHKKFRFNPVLSYKELLRISRGVDKNINLLKQQLNLIPGNLLGNPVFYDRVNYEQDYAQSCMEYFKSHEREDNNKIITKYVELILELWKYGFHDDIYNFPMNSGVDKNGQVIMIDLGEFVYDKEMVMQSVKDKKWLSKPFYAVFKGIWSREHFRKEMDRLITVENLDKYWRLKIKN
jgi:hypothetical protein